MVDALTSALQLLVHLELLYHVFGWLVEPSKLQIKIIAILSQQKMHLDFLYTDQ